MKVESNPAEPLASSAEALESLELKISHFLRWGVLLSGSLLLMGWCLQLVQQNGIDPFSVFDHYEQVSLRTQLVSVWADREIGKMLSYAGLFLLISLPIIRVALTAFLFLKQREKILASVALLVLLCLLFSFTQGIEL